MRFTLDKRFTCVQEWGNRKPEWHWHAYRRHMVRRREQAARLAGYARRWRRMVVRITNERRRRRMSIDRAAQLLGVTVADILAACEGPSPTMAQVMNDD